MRLSRLRVGLVLVGASRLALAQVAAPAAEPRAASESPRAVGPIEPTPPPSEPAPERPAPTEPPPESAPAPDKAPETATPPEAPADVVPVGPAQVVAPTDKPATPAAVPWERAHWPLTLEGRVGFALRPGSDPGFDHESHVGSELGLSLYLDLKRALAAGLEIERTSLGRGTGIDGLDSASIDYTVSSAMLGVRAYPKRSEIFDLFVGLQVGIGIQGVSAQGTRNNGAVTPASAYSCGASDSPAFQIGAGVGGRLMITPRWGVTARVNGTARRLSADVIDDCAPGIGAATTVSGGIGVGYDFDLDP